MSSQCSLACGTNRWIIQIIGAMLRRREHKSFLEQLGKTSEQKWDIGRIRRNIILSEGTHCVFCFRFPGVLCVYKENVEKLAPVSFHDKGLPWDKHERFHWNNSWKCDSEEARERERNEGGHYSWTHGGGRTPLRSLGGWAPGLCLTTAERNTFTLGAAPLSSLSPPRSVKQVAKSSRGSVPEPGW